MKDLAPYLYPLIFAALMLLNYLMQRIAKWQKQQSAQEQEDQNLPPKEPQGLAERKQRFEGLHKRQQAQRLREESTPAGGGRRPAVPSQRVRAAEEEPPEVRQARARATRPEVMGLPIRARRATGVRGLLTNRRSLRQAIVLMAVLGPCRAQESTGVQATRQDA